MVLPNFFFSARAISSIESSQRRCPPALIFPTRLTSHGTGPSQSLSHIKRQRLASDFSLCPALFHARSENVDLSDQNLVHHNKRAPSLHTEGAINTVN